MSVENRLWKKISFSNPYPNFMKPNRFVMLIARLMLVPVAIFALFTTTWVILINIAGMLMEVNGLGSAVKSAIFSAAILGGFGFLFILSFYRIIRQLQQLRFNGYLKSTPPENYILYLRSFRRTGSVVVPSQLDSIAERHLLGDFWDTELALSFCLHEKLPIVAVGAKATSLGAAKFTTNDALWQNLVKNLAYNAKAIFIVPDDREGTLWELQYVFSEPELRMKTLIFMPPEQRGWFHYFKRLPKIEDSWNKVSQSLANVIKFPPYTPQGAILRYEQNKGKLEQFEVFNFKPSIIRELVAATILKTNYALTDDISHNKAPIYEDSWKFLVNPMFFVVVTIAFFLSIIIANRHNLPLDFELMLLAAGIGFFISAITKLYRFTFTRIELKSQEWIKPSTWLGLRAAPSAIRSSLNIFVVMLMIIIIRLFIVESFRIPSGSMTPTLIPNDFILVNKFTYGIRLPVLHTQIIEMNKPERGELVVFRYPKDPSVDFIDRVIGLPGDKIVYYQKKLYINDQPVNQVSLGTYQEIKEEDYQDNLEHLQENLAPIKHSILINQAYDARDGEYVVPVGHYFVMGDNRDNSNDSRYWGVVPEENLVGKAFFIWMHWDKKNEDFFKQMETMFKRIGTI